MHPDKIKIAVLGLGYVGLPLAKAFAKHFPVVGFDVNEELVERLRSNVKGRKVEESKDHLFTGAYNLRLLDFTISRLHDS